MCGVRHYARTLAARTLCKEGQTYRIKVLKIDLDVSNMRILSSCGKPEPDWCDDANENGQNLEPLFGGISRTVVSDGGFIAGG